MARWRPIRRTPLPAAFSALALAFLAGCQSNSGLRELPFAFCESGTTPVADVQGNGQSSPMADEPVTVRGVVTWREPGAGVYLEELGSDADPDTSNGLYLQHPDMAAQVRLGDRLAASGRVAELGEGPDTLTSLSRIDGVRICESGIPLPSSQSRLPLDAEAREALEAMRVSFRQALAVTDVYRLRTGQIGVSAGGVLPAPTEVARPGRDARRQAASNRRALLPVQIDPEDGQDFAVGATVMALEGLMGHDGERQRFYAEAELPLMDVIQYASQPAAEGELRIISLNLHNYFNGNGRGGGFPTTRGAETPEQFERQRRRIVASLEFLQPHLVAVMELENDGFGPGSAARDFLDDLQRATGVPWAAVDPLDGPIGTDEITVGLFYRTDLLKARGTGWVLASAPFQNLNRQPLAQVFQHLPSGADWLVAVNHLKSKGGCPDGGPDADKRDGQGCWNATRTEAADQMVYWVQRLADDLTDGRALVLGDLNAYRLEDPIEKLFEAGLKDLTASSELGFEYSFVYRGQAGTLDHAFATPALAPWIRSGRIVNINAPYPPGVELPLPWLRSSDHDPVVVDLRPPPERSR